MTEYIWTSKEERDALCDAIQAALEASPAVMGLLKKQALYDESGTTERSFEDYDDSFSVDDPCYVRSWVLVVSVGNMQNYETSMMVTPWGQSVFTTKGILRRAEELT